jgi:hypothetical protein
MVVSGGLGQGCHLFLLVDAQKSDPGKGPHVQRVIREQLARYVRNAGYGERIPIHLSDASLAKYWERLRVTGRP